MCKTFFPGNSNVNKFAYVNKDKENKRKTIELLVN